MRAQAELSAARPAHLSTRPVTPPARSSSPWLSAVLPAAAQAPATDGDLQSYISGYCDDPVHGTYLLFVPAFE